MSNQDITTNLRAVLSFYKKLADKTPYYNPIYYNSNSEDNVFMRLERAAFDQRDCNDVATFSRYAIWAEDIRFLIYSSLKELENGDEIDIRKKLTLALNSIGAFVDIMAMFDAQPGKMAFNDPEKIIEGYLEFDAVDKSIQRNND